MRGIGKYLAKSGLLPSLPSRRERSAPGTYVFLKRGSDAIGAAVALLILAPLMGGVAIALRSRMGVPVLFTQQRPGLHGRPFMIFKFRTMADVPGSDAQRLTPLGAFLRRTSLDELPELFNVLRGDMSLVGPRPLLMEYLDRYTPEQARRHEVRPGITGLAQVSGRNALSWEEKFRLDTWYVDNYSFMLDMKILARTVAKVIRGDGIAAEGHVTMPRFGVPEGEG
jgi:sugar transferase EpsL